jgi:hypothetical protein
MPRKCVEPTCNTEPSYNLEGEKAKYCGIHKLENMVNVKSKRCSQDNCNKQPIYNEEGETKALFCFNHKLENMIDVRNKKCIHPNCKTRPTYNYQYEKVAKYCLNHKLENMVNVKDKTCIYPNCKIRPNYNEEGETRALYCSEHKLVDMIDVRHKTCVHPNCKIRPNYNEEGQTKALYCLIHKTEKMINVVSKRCQSDFCDIFVTKKNDGYCLPCYIHLFPDKPIARNYKTKEKIVSNFVLENFKNITIITDKKVQDGCSRRRPDLLLDLGYQIIIVEIDENQHTDYDCSCENKRIMELSQDVNHRPIIFIRFNPDDYKNINNENITSCFGMDNRSGVLIVKKSKQKEWNERLNVLKNVIEYWINPANKTDKIIEIIQLFYDTNV